MIQAPGRLQPTQVEPLARLHSKFKGRLLALSEKIRLVCKYSAPDNALDYKCTLKNFIVKAKGHLSLTVDA
jgi:hypothetical protein